MGRAKNTLCAPHAVHGSTRCRKPYLGTTVHLETPPASVPSWFQCDPSATALTPLSSGVHLKSLDTPPGKWAPVAVARGPSPVCSW